MSRRRRRTQEDLQDAMDKRALGFSAGEVWPFEEQELANLAANWPRVGTTATTDALGPASVVLRMANDSGDPEDDYSPDRQDVDNLWTDLGGGVDYDADLQDSHDFWDGFVEGAFGLNDGDEDEEIGTNHLVSFVIAGVGNSTQVRQFLRYIPYDAHLWRLVERRAVGRAHVYCTPTRRGFHIMSDGVTVVCFIVTGVTREKAKKIDAECAHIDEWTQESFTAALGKALAPGAEVVHASAR